MLANVLKKFQDMSKRKRQTIIFSVVFLCGAVLVGLALYLYFQQGTYNVYENKQYAFTIKYPADWTYQEGYLGTVVIFLAPKENELDVYRESVSVVFLDISATPMSLAQYTENVRKHLSGKFSEFGALVEEGRTMLSGEPAYRYVWRENTEEANGTQFLHVWTIASSNVYQVTYSALASKYDKFYKIAKTMVGSFQITR